MTCSGYRQPSGQLLILCLCCSLQDTKGSKDLCQASRNDVWRRENFRPHPSPAGHFAALISNDTRAKHLQSQSIRARLEGKGWALGTIRLCGTPTYKPPGDM